MAWASEAPKPVRDTSFDNMVLAWRRSVDVLNKAKEEELELRNQIAALAFVEPKEGVNRFDLGGGYKLKLTHRLNYTLDDTLIDEALERIEKIGNEGPFVAKRLVSFKPTLSTGEYKKIDNSLIRGIIDEVLTITPGTPALELEEPK